MRCARRGAYSLSSANDGLIACRDRLSSGRCLGKLGEATIRVGKRALDVICATFRACRARRDLRSTARIRSFNLSRRPPQAVHFDHVYFSRPLRSSTHGGLPVSQNIGGELAAKRRWKRTILRARQRVPGAIGFSRLGIPFEPASSLALVGRRSSIQATASDTWASS